MPSNTHPPLLFAATPITSSDAGDGLGVDYGSLQPPPSDYALAPGSVERLPARGARKLDQDGYRFYVVREGAEGKLHIESGWEYKEDANDGRRDGPNPAGAKVYSRSYLVQRDCDPADNANWASGSSTERLSAVGVLAPVVLAVPAVAAGLSYQRNRSVPLAAAHSLVATPYLAYRAAQALSSRGTTERMLDPNHPMAALSRWQSSNYTDREAADELSRVVGFNVADKYADPFADRGFWDGEIEQAIIEKYGDLTETSRVSGGPLDPPEVLWHATERGNVPSLLKHGMKAPSWWGSEAIARYYAEDMEDPVLLCIPTARFPALLPDNNSVAEPLTRVLGTDEESVWQAWKEAEGTWQDSYRIVESVRCDLPVSLLPGDVREMRWRSNTETSRVPGSSLSKQELIELVHHIRDNEQKLVPDDEDAPEMGGQTLFPDGTPSVVCTNWARYTRGRLGRGKVLGYQHENNPTAEAGQGEGGHDFLVVDDRWIVDGWILDMYQQKPGVWDLNDPADAAEIRRLYGDRRTWMAPDPSDVDWTPPTKSRSTTETARVPAAPVAARPRAAKAPAARPTPARPAPASAAKPSRPAPSSKPTGKPPIRFGLGSMILPPNTGYGSEHVIGYWRNEDSPELPDPKAFVDASWSATERKAVVAYLEGAPVDANYRGMSLCRICGKMNGSAEHSDGKYRWPSGFAHYLTAHNVKPPQVFIDHALRKAGKPAKPIASTAKPTPAKPTAVKPTAKPSPAKPKPSATVKPAASRPSTPRPSSPRPSGPVAAKKRGR